MSNALLAVTKMYHIVQSLWIIAPSECKIKAEVMIIHQEYTLLHSYLGPLVRQYQNKQMTKIIIIFIIVFLLIEV